ncbi:unnamed protein product [Mytilus edulis]|uniref:CIDE-N domain-containing protein n=1 Tax=Mytilus edulis TaxID=6550 RepID=A0A8S3Q5K5_MYTED|nr:unnamed protein product [Mytilus edulis]
MSSPKGREKFNHHDYGKDNIKVVLYDDGMEVDSDSFLFLDPNTSIMILQGNEIWSPPLPPLNVDDQYDVNEDFEDILDDYLMNPLRESLFTNCRLGTSLLKQNFLETSNSFRFEEDQVPTTSTPLRAARYMFKFDIYRIARNAFEQSNLQLLIC